MILLFGSWRLNWEGKENTGWATLVPRSQPHLHSHTEENMHIKLTMSYKCMLGPVMANQSLVPYFGFTLCVYMSSINGLFLKFVINDPLL